MNENNSTKYLLNSPIIPREKSIVKQATSLMYARNNVALWENNNYLKVILAPRLAELIRNAELGFTLTEYEVMPLLGKPTSDYPIAESYKFLTKEKYQTENKSSQATFGTTIIDIEEQPYAITLGWDKNEGIYLVSEQVDPDPSSNSLAG